MPTLKKDLEYFGDELQYRFVKSLIERPYDFVEIESYLNPKVFNDEGLVNILTSMKSFYKEKGMVPSYRDLEYYIKYKAKTEEELNEAYSAYKRIKDEDDMFDGMDTANEIGLRYVKRMETLNQLENAKTSIKNSDYSPERLSRIVEGLQGIETNGNVDCISPGAMFNDMMNEARSERVCTGLDPLDKQMNGGLGRTMTGLLIAGTGVGKTTLFSIMACRAAMKGHKVLYIFFEDKDTDFCRKFYSVITKRSTDDFHIDSQNKEEAEAQVKSIFAKDPDIKKAFFENVKALRMANGETDVDAVKKEIRKLIVNGWRPDVVFLDYIQCMKSSSDGRMSIDKEYATLDRCMKRLDSFAQEENFALWVAQQTNRDGNKKESVDRIGNIQGSFRLCQTASAILYLERNKEDDGDYNRINLYLDKCRGAQLGEWKGIYMNNGTCQIDFDDTISGKDVFGEETYQRERYDEETGEVKDY